MRPDDATRAVVQRYCDAWAAGDLQGVVDSYADDIVLHYRGTHRFAGDHVGKDAALAVLAETAGLATRELLAVDDILVGDGDPAAGAGTAIVVVRERFHRDGRAHELTRLLRYRVAGEQLAECWLHDDDQALVDHLWR